MNLANSCNTVLMPSIALIRIPIMHCLQTLLILAGTRLLSDRQNQYIFANFTNFSNVQKLKFQDGDYKTLLLR